MKIELRKLKNPECPSRVLRVRWRYLYCCGAVYGCLAAGAAWGSAVARKGNPSASHANVSSLSPLLHEIIVPRLHLEIVIICSRGQMPLSAGSTLVMRGVLSARTGSATAVLAVMTRLITTADRSNGVLHLV